MIFQIFHIDIIGNLMSSNQATSNTAIITGINNLTIGLNTGTNNIKIVDP